MSFGCVWDFGRVFGVDALCLHLACNGESGIFVCAYDAFFVLFNMRGDGCCDLVNGGRNGDVGDIDYALFCFDNVLFAKYFFECRSGTDVFEFHINNLQEVEFRLCIIDGVVRSFADVLDDIFKVCVGVSFGNFFVSWLLCFVISCRKRAHCQ